MEFDGFSFCKEKKAELSDRKGEIETERSFKVDRFVPSHPPENGLSFRNSREENSEPQKIEEQRVNFYFYLKMVIWGFSPFGVLGENLVILWIFMSFYLLIYNENILQIFLPFLSPSFSQKNHPFS